VLPEVLLRFKATLVLTAGALAIALVLGLPAGIISAVKQYSWLDRLSMGVAVTGVSLPVFWTGIMLIIVFALQLRWFPSSGMSSPSMVTPSSSRASRRAAAAGSSSGSITPFGNCQAPASLLRHKGPPGWTSNISMPHSRQRYINSPALRSFTSVSRTAGDIQPIGPSTDWAHLPTHGPKRLPVLVLVMRMLMLPVITTLEVTLKLLAV